MYTFAHKDKGVHDPDSLLSFPMKLVTYSRMLYSHMCLRRRGKYYSPGMFFVRGTQGAHYLVLTVEYFCVCIDEGMYDGLLVDVTPQEMYDLVFTFSGRVQRSWAP